MNKKIFSFFITLLLMTTTSLQASENTSSKHILENGLTVLIREMPSNEMVSVYGLVQAGSATEGQFLGTGISHFLEHMLFKGTHTRGVGEIAAKVQAVGGSVNASTGKDYTIYTITVPFEEFDIALDILADMLMNATMEPQEVEKEREVIFGEMRLHEDNPSRTLGQLTYQQSYLRHPYRHPIIGYKSLLADVSRTDIVDYYEQYYAPNNIVLSIAGNVQTNNILPLIKEKFKNFKRNHDIPRNLPEEPQQISSKRYEETYATDLTRLSMTFKSTRLLHEDLYPMDVLAKILGQGRSSRFYLELYKKQRLVHSISSSNYTPIDKGLFEVRALLETENTNKTIASIWEQINKIKETGITDSELQKAKRQVLSEHVFSHQTTSQIAYSQAIDEAFTGNSHFSDEYVLGIKKTTNDAIMRVAKKYLKETALTTIILKPKNEIKEDVENAFKKELGQIKKYTLKNGITVLLREDHTIPLVSVRLLLQGGSRQEELKHSGISTLMASLWTKGTTTQTANQIAEQTESLGMHLSGYSGKNSLGLSLQFLTEDYKKAFALLNDIIQNPIFPKDEMDKIKINMKTALRQRDDNIFRFTSQALKETLFLTHPFRLDKNGTEETIDAITQTDIITFYQSFVTPSNMILNVFGDIDSESMLAMIKENFEDIPTKEITLKIYQEDLPQEPREKILSLNKQQAMLMMGFQGSTIKNEDRHGLEVMTAVLGSSFSGRLFNRIREDLGQAYTLGGSFAPGIDAGFIYFYVLTTNENVFQTKELIKEEIKKLQMELVTDEELEDTQRYLKGSFKEGIQTNSSLSFTSGLDELYGLDFLNYKSYAENIDSVTKEDIQKLAIKYLNLNASAIVITKSENKE